MDEDNVEASFRAVAGPNFSGTLNRVILPISSIRRRDSRVGGRQTTMLVPYRTLVRRGTDINSDIALLTMCSHILGYSGEIGFAARDLEGMK
jgi:hypothetical protein